MFKNASYSCIVFLENDKPKKWTYVRNLKDFASFLDKSHSSWIYINVYDRRKGTYIKRFHKGNIIPKFIPVVLLALTLFLIGTFSNNRSALFFARTFKTHLHSPPCTPLYDFNNTATIPTERKLQGGDKC